MTDPDPAASQSALPDDAGQVAPEGEAWPEWASRFLKELHETGSVTDAAKAVSLTRQAVYAWRKKAPSFGTAWDDAIEHPKAEEMRLARERAFNGWLEPVYHNGRIIDVRRRYSDGLASLLIRNDLEKGGARKDRGQTASETEIAQALADLLSRMQATIPAPTAARTPADPLPNPEAPAS